jgi:hypothetical protein
LKLKIKKYVAEGQSSVVDQIKDWFGLMNTAKKGNPAPLLAKLTGNPEIGKYVKNGDVSSDVINKPEVLEALKPFLVGASVKTEALVTEDTNPVEYQVNTGEMSKEEPKAEEVPQSTDDMVSEQPKSSGNHLDAKAVYKAALTSINKLSQTAVERRVVSFGSLTALDIISTANPEFISRALKYSSDQVKKEVLNYVSEPTSAGTLGLDWFLEFSEDVTKALEKVEEVRSRSKTDEINALATMIVSQYSGQDFTKILQDYVSKHPGQSPCDGIATIDGQKEPVTILGLAVKSFTNGVTRPLEYLAKTFPQETLEDDGEGNWQAPILSAPTEKQDEVQEMFHKYKQEKGSSVTRDPELDKVSDDELSSDRFGGDVNAFLKDLLTPYLMVSFDGKIVNDSNDLIKEIQAPLGDEVKQKGTLKLSTVQQFAKHAIDNGLVEMDVDEDALEISKMKRGMKEVCKKIIDTLGKQSRSNSNGLTKSEQRFLRGIAKKCALLPNGGIASLEKLRELRDLGKKKGMLHKWLSNPRNKQFKQGALRGVLGRIAHPIDTVVNAAKDVGEKLGFGESQDFNELQFRTYQRVVESRVKDPFGQRELLKTTSEDYLFLDEE